jgi:hypothetical protein
MRSGASVNRIAVRRLSYLGSTAGFWFQLKTLRLGRIRFMMLWAGYSYRNACWLLGGNVKNRVIESSSVSGLPLSKFAPPASLHYGRLRVYSRLLSKLLGGGNAQDRPGVLPVLPQVQCLRL